MTARADIEDPRRLGEARPAPGTVAVPRRQALEPFGTQSLWSRRRFAHPTIAQMLAVAPSLRREGSVKTPRIEKARRAAI